MEDKRLDCYIKAFFVIQLGKKISLTGFLLFLSTPTFEERKNRKNKAGLHGDKKRSKEGVKANLAR